MEWTCAQHIRHGKSYPGHTKLQKFYLWVRCTKFMSHAFPQNQNLPSLTHISLPTAAPARPNFAMSIANSRGRDASTTPSPHLPHPNPPLSPHSATATPPTPHWLTLPPHREPPRRAPSEDGTGLLRMPRAGALTITHYPHRAAHNPQMLTTQPQTTFHHHR